MKKINSILNYFKTYLGNPELSRVIFEITHRCNARCKICNIWKYKKNDEKELTLDEIKTIFKQFKNLEQVVITGGEPFLREDLPEIVSCISTSSIRINTNGLVPNKIINSVKRILELKNFNDLIIVISLHGIGNTHDKIRGVSNAYKRALRTLNLLKKLSHIQTNLHIVILSVITPNVDDRVISNVDDILDIYEFSKRNNFYFFAQIAHERRPHSLWNLKFLNEKERKRAEKLLSKLEQESPESAIKLFYKYNKFFFKNPTKQPIPCFAGIKGIVINPYGNVYPCVVLKNKPMGSLRRNSLKQIMQSKKAKEIRRFIKEGNCSCWLWCEAPISMYRNLKSLIKMSISKLKKLKI